MKVQFLSKPSRDELIPADKFMIEKTITLDPQAFESFLDRPLRDYDFIKEYVDYMYCELDGIYQCIYVTSDEHDFGILVESEGYHYARYAAYLPKPKQ